jgi:molybdopterin/thiamine biosynthesis adenylyltransferase
MTRLNPLELLHDSSQIRSRPDGSSYRAITLKVALSIASRLAMTLYQLEEIALQADILPERYSRNQKSLTSADQLKLHRSTVAITGLGGLGGAVTEILARTGVGRLTLIDGDSFDESNLNRQLLSSVKHLGHAKAEVARQRVAEINPSCQVRAEQQFLSAENGESLLEGADLAIDCLDTIKDRFILEEACRQRSIPMVSAAIGGSCGQATVIFPGDPGLKLIYGNKDQAPKKGIEASLGTLPFAAIYMACVECSEAINLLLGRQSELRNGLLITDISDHSANLVSFAD